jgi:hypothetical protein
MHRCSKIRTALGGAVLVTLVAGPSHAYVCSGNGNEFQDSQCSEADLAASIGVSVEDFVLLAKDETNADNEPDGTPEETPFGVLSILQTYDQDNPLTPIIFSYSGITPAFIVEKYDGLYSVYDWGTQIAANADGTYQFVRETSLTAFGGDDFVCDTNPSGKETCNYTAGTSHLSAYGVVPIPAAVWLFGSALVGMVGVGYRRSRTA